MSNGVRLAFLLALAGTWLPYAPAARAAGHRYALDPVHTRVVLAVRHAGFSDAVGTVSGSTGRIEFDPDDWSRARVDVAIPLGRLDFGDPDWNRAVLARGLLDAAAHPVARFVSDRIEPLTADNARVHGTLTLRGVSRPLVLDAVVNANRRHPLPPFRHTLGVSATASLSRADYGIRAWKSVIGDTVALRIELEATRDRDAGAPSADGGDGAPDVEADPLLPAPPDGPAPADAPAPPPSTPDPAGTPT